jgi:hypothetical protein
MTSEFLSKSPLPDLGKGWPSVTLAIVIHLDAGRDQWQIGWTIAPTDSDEVVESVALSPIAGVQAEQSILLRCHALLDRAYERIEPF